jgi:protoporphyrin/coproporphyrin ferrochelatase
MTAVLCMAYGSPRNLDEVERYLTDVRGGRPFSPELLDHLKGRYEAVGGRTPLLETTERQALALQAELGDGWQTYVGMKHWHPYIAEAVGKIAADGHDTVIGLALAPHFSTISIGGYRDRVERARDEAGADLRLVMVEAWYDEPAFVDLVASNLSRAVGDRTGTRVFFTAHSLPERILAAGDPYRDQLHESAKMIADAAGVSDWTFAFQSASSTGEPWLGPDILDALTAWKAEGGTDAVVAPIGFVSDHLEILYDIDIEAAQKAAELGLTLRRIPSPTTTPGSSPPWPTWSAGRVIHDDHRAVRGAGRPGRAAVQAGFGHRRRPRAAAQAQRGCGRARGGVHVPPHRAVRDVGPRPGRRGPRAGVASARPASHRPPRPEAARGHRRGRAPVPRGRRPRLPRHREPQILGQVRRSLVAAREEGSAGPVMATVFGRAIRIGRRVRSETPLGSVARSIGSIAVEHLADRLHDLRDRVGAVVGAGEAATDAARALHAQGARIAVLSRTTASARHLADELGARSHPLSDMPTVFSQSDFAIVAVSGGVLVHPTDLPMRTPDDPFVVLDLSVPAAVDAFGRTDVVLRSLEEIPGPHSPELASAVIDGEALVRKEVASLERWTDTRTAGPAIRDLRTTAERLVRSEVARALGTLDLTDEQAEKVSAMAMRIANKLVHGPSAALREADPETRQLILRMFGLED